MKLSDTKKLFVRFILRQASRDEDKRVVDSDDSRLMTSTQWEDPDAVADHYPAPDTVRIHRNINHFIEADSHKARIQKEVPLLRRWYSAAAIAAVITGLAVFFLTGQMNTTTVEIVHQRTGQGQRLQVTLPDGSGVWMNGESTLSYAMNMGESDERKVQLSGEAFFNVQSSPQQPFIVETEVMSVRATGTRFNVINYFDDKYAEALLLEGKVDVLNTTNTKKPESVTMAENTRLRYNKNSNTYYTREIDARRYAAWRFGDLIFDNDPLEEIVRRLEHWYGVDFIVDDALKGKNRYTFHIQDDSLADVLKWLKKTTPMKISNQGNRVFLNPDNE